MHKEHALVQKYLNLCRATIAFWTSYDKLHMMIYMIYIFIYVNIFINSPPKVLSLSLNVSHLSSQKLLTTKSTGYTIHVVFLVTLLILNHIGQGWLHNAPCDWSILKIHFQQMESCSWVTALITHQTVPQICQHINSYCHMDHVKQLAATLAILVKSTHPIRKWQTLYESVRKLHSIMIT